MVQSEILIRQARLALSQRDWTSVSDCAEQLMQRAPQNPEAWFLRAMAHRAGRRNQAALRDFEQCLALDPARYDAAIELASICWQQLQHARAADLLKRYQSACQNSPMYCHKAGEVYRRLGLHEMAYASFKQALALQPEIDQFKASFANAATLVGDIDGAEQCLRALLEKYPEHQRHHNELAKLKRAQDDQHVDQMIRLLKSGHKGDEQCIFLLYAIAKELEDLEQWAAAFDYYSRAGAAAASVAKRSGYRVEADIRLMQSVVKHCSAAWLQLPEVEPDGASRPSSTPTPIFVVGLPRTGTTLVERILSSHSQVESVDESFFMSIAIKQLIADSTTSVTAPLTPGDVERARLIDFSQLATRYVDLVRYRLTDRPYFLEKYPFNFLYLGFIAKAFPQSRIVYLHRDPMDACFAMFKQSYFQFAYDLNDLAQYYVAYDELQRHWQSVLGDRLVNVSYERLVDEPEVHIPQLLSSLNLDFESACLHFYANQTASATASSVQIREKMHTRSVGKWRHWREQLTPLTDALHTAGVWHESER